MAVLKNKLKDAARTVKRHAKTGILIGSGAMAMAGASCTNENITDEIQQQIPCDSTFIRTDKNSSDFETFYNGERAYGMGNEEIKKHVLEITKQKNILVGLVLGNEFISRAAQTKQGTENVPVNHPNLRQIEVRIFPTSIDAAETQAVIELSNMVRASLFGYFQWIENKTEYTIPENLKIDIQSNIMSISVKSNIGAEYVDDIQLLQAWGITFTNLDEKSPQLAQALASRKNPYVGRVTAPVRNQTMPAAVFMEMMQKQQQSGK